ncbi:hypothetical protein IEQ34_002389 [Dendrobium chrysotoxum]|uniref:Ribosomal protein L33 n=1 Tax=Dendrobium chrysotoxum TaxID=161865 RepID=A0AAV7HNB2_DENCH|nr:hypothetical protein IEQ34_002389 [Dendrobium chrysotoxum]
MRTNKPYHMPHVILTIKGQDGNAQFYKIKRNTQLKKLIDIHCNRNYRICLFAVCAVTSEEPKQPKAAVNS